MSEKDNSHYPQLVQRIGNEIAFEFFFVVLCFVLAVGLEWQVALTVAVTCLKFAIPDWVTAYLVKKHDPSPQHGLGVALLFIAHGFARASIFAFIAVFTAAVVIAPILQGFNIGKFVFPGLISGFVCAFSFLGLVFPFCLAAVFISAKHKTKLFFSAGLTKLRRASESKKQNIDLSVHPSLKWITIVSAIGLSVCLIGLLFLMPQKGMFLDSVVLLTLLGAFLLPFPWAVFMGITVSPRYKVVEKAQS